MFYPGYIFHLYIIKPYRLLNTAMLVMIILRLLKILKSSYAAVTP